MSSFKKVHHSVCQLAKATTKSVVMIINKKVIWFPDFTVIQTVLWDQTKIFQNKLGIALNIEDIKLLLHNIMLSGSIGTSK